MSLKQKISDDFTKAFKNKETAKKDVLSLVNSEIKNKEIELGKREEGLSDQEVICVIQKGVKQRKDSVEQYKEGGREELAQSEQQEIEILEKYLPKQLSDEEVKQKIKQIVDETGAEGMSDMGMVMGRAMADLKCQADGSKVKEIVQALLKEKNG